MDREDIFKLAKEHGFRIHTTGSPSVAIRVFSGYMEELIAFANAIAAHEREKIAKFCEENQVAIGLVGKNAGKISFVPHDKSTFGRHEGMAYADAIRSRGNK